MTNKETKPYRVTHKTVKWEYPFVFAYSIGQAIQSVIDSLPVEKKNKDLYSARNWSAKEMMK